MPSGSIYTYVANANPGDGTNQIVTSQGTVPLGGYGYFLPDEVVIAESKGLILEAGIVGPAQPGSTGPRLVSTLKSTSGTVPVADGNGGYTWEAGGGAAALEVTDGITTVADTTEIDFTSGLVVTSGGTGVAEVALSSSVVTASSSGIPAWAASTAYAVNTLVTNGGNTYICTTAHTSGSTFSGESGDWQQIGGSGGGLPSGGSVGQVVTNTGSGTGDWEWPFPGFIRISDQGAKGDCRFGSECTTTASSTTVTVTDGSLTSADVGKTIVINGACNATGGGSWATTISSVTNSTTCVVASAPTKSVTNLSWAIGTDDTTAFNNAITAGQALGALRWTLLLDDVAYMIAGPLVTTNGYNTQIPLPYITTVADRVTIEIRGKSLRPTPYFATGNSNWTNEPNGPVLFSAITNQAVGGGNPYSSAVGLQSMIGGPASAGPAGLGAFTQVAPIFRGITFLGPHWPGGVMTDMGGCQQASFQDCLWATNESQSQASPGWRTNAACIMPLYDNNAPPAELRGFNSSINHTIGFVLGEHSNVERLYVFQAQGGVAFPTWQNQSAPEHVSHLHTQSCVYHLTGWDPGNAASFGINTGSTAYLEVDLWAIEGLSSGTYLTSYHVYCGVNTFVDAKIVSTDLGAPTPAIESNNTRLITLGTPRGPKAAPTVPSSGTTFPLVYRDTIYIFTTNWPNVTSATIAGVAVGLAAGQNPATITVPSGMGLTLTYTGTAPTLAGFVVL